MHQKLPAAAKPAEKELPEWAAWKGDGPAPNYWWARNPKTGERTQVYRSYDDYCG